MALCLGEQHSLPPKWGLVDRWEHMCACVIACFLAACLHQRWGRGHKYSRIPLIQHPQGWTGARLSNIPDHQTVHILTKFLQDIFCYCSYT